MTASPAGAPDRGSGTVSMLALVGVVLSLVALLSGVGAAVLARHRAEAAADLAALAAAGAAAGPDCLRAGAVAQAGGGDLAICRPGGDGSVIVEVDVPVLAWPAALGPRPRARARARAGQPPSEVAAGAPSDVSRVGPAGVCRGLSEGGCARMRG